LPSSLTSVRSIASVCSTCPPASVWGTGSDTTSLEAFLGSIGSPTSPQSARHHASESHTKVPPPGFAWEASYTLTPRRPTRGLGYHPASPHRSPAAQVCQPRRPHPKARPAAVLVPVGPAWARCLRYRNINRSSIDYASRPRLRSRLTLGGLTFPRNPWAIGGRVSLPSFATHAGIRTRQASTARLPGRFTRLTTLPYPSTHLNTRSLPLALGRTLKCVRMPQLRWCA
jgi:hypothetical protein